MKISISALSIAYGLSSEALRYYEEKGLLTPERTSSSGFRKFSLADMQRLGIIKSLQKQGFSLDEIRHILTNCSLSEFVSMTDEKRRQLTRDISYSLCIQDRLTSAADVLRDAQHLLMQPRLAPGCAAYLAHFDSAASLWQSVPHSANLRDLIDALPLTSYCTIIPLEKLKGEDVPLRKGICAPAEYAAVIRADFSQMRMSAGPRSVRVLFELIPQEHSSLSPVIACAHDFINSNGLTPASDSFTRQYAWFVDHQGRQKQYSELFIPVL